MTKPNPRAINHEAPFACAIYSDAVQDTGATCAGLISSCSTSAPENSHVPTGGVTACCGTIAGSGAATGCCNCSSGAGGWLGVIVPCGCISSIVHDKYYALPLCLM